MTMWASMAAMLSGGNAFGGYQPDYYGGGGSGAGSSDGGSGGGGGFLTQQRRVVRGETWRANSPIAFAGGYAPALSVSQFPSLARASPVKDVEDVIPALSDGVEVLREILTPLTSGKTASKILGGDIVTEIGAGADADAVANADADADAADVSAASPSAASASITPNAAWISSARLARMHSALDYVLRTTHSNSKRALGYAPRDRPSLDPRSLSHGQDVRAIALEMQADDEQRMLLFSKGIVPYLTDIIDHVSADECVPRAHDDKRRYIFAHGSPHPAPAPLFHISLPCQVPPSARGRDSGHFEPLVL